MSFRLRSKRPIATEIRRVADEQLAAAIAQLKAPRSGRTGNAIHETRKRLKHVCALFRLIANRAHQKTIKKEVAALREIAHALAPLRDAYVRWKSLEKLDRCKQGCRFRFFRVQKELRAEYQQVRRTTSDNGTLEHLIDALKSTRRRARKLDLNHLRKRDLRLGLKRSCRRARDAKNRATSHPSTKDLHHWRGECKDYGYHLRLLREMCNGRADRTRRMLERLAHLLGEDHDLAMLSFALKKRAGESIDFADVESILPVVELQRRQLQRQFAKLGERV